VLAEGIWIADAAIAPSNRLRDVRQMSAEKRGRTYHTERAVHWLAVLCGMLAKILRGANRTRPPWCGVALSVQMLAKISRRADTACAPTKGFART
jgi:hypothetical protein